MTTIAADARTGVMVADSKTSDGVTKWSSQKIERIGGSLFGCAGRVSSIEKVLRWLRKSRIGKKPRVTDFIALELNSEGLFLWDSDLDPFGPGRDFHAVGSGAAPAMAALLLGCDAEKAVATACLVDDGSEGPIQVEKL